MESIKKIKKEIEMLKKRKAKLKLSKALVKLSTTEKIRDRINELLSDERCGLWHMEELKKEIEG